ncbi:unnamed protein product, partial [Amoebophrya sp. A25]|eukprot:GSA25T00019324001.1
MDVDALCEPRALSRSHVLLIVLMFLEKFRDSVDGFQTIDIACANRFSLFFEAFLDQVNAPDCLVTYATATQRVSTRKVRLSRREYTFY